jgi:hypothetical protein
MSLSSANRRTAIPEDGIDPPERRRRDRQPPVRQERDHLPANLQLGI